LLLQSQEQEQEQDIQEQEQEHQQQQQQIQEYFVCLTHFAQWTQQDAAAVQLW